MSFTRHPIPRERPNFHDIMLVLLQEDKSIYDIPDEDLSTHSDAGTLGADLQAGEKMYEKLQRTYYYKDTSTDEVAI